MDQAAPIIYSRAGHAQALGIRGRAAALAVAIGCFALLFTAARLTPSPDGVGSHTELGLARCQWLEHTGIPCPSCGMTTSWTWFVRGNLAASIYLQPMGTVLAIIASCCVWAGFYIALTGRPIYRLLNVLPGRYYFLPLVALAIVAWGWKIFIHLKGIDGWVVK